MTVSVPSEPVWSLERRESGHFFWRRDASKVKFRCEIEVLEYDRDPDDDLQPCMPDSAETTGTATHAVIVCVTCVVAVAVTVLLPWILIGGN